MFVPAPQKKRKTPAAGSEGDDLQASGSRRRATPTTPTPSSPLAKRAKKGQKSSGRAASQVPKATESKTAAAMPMPPKTPRKGRENKDFADIVFPERPPLERTVRVFTTRSMLYTLRDSEDEGDYGCRLHHFFARAFLLARQFSLDERECLFEAAIPAFAKDDSGTVERLSGVFDVVYNKFLTFIRQKIRLYGDRFIKVSSAGRDWVEARLLAKKRKNTKFPTPPNPKTIHDMLKFRNLDGLTFELYECVDFWMPVVLMLPHSSLQDSDVQGHIGWITKENNGDYWMEVLRGVALELIRRYVLSVVVHPGDYSEEKKLHDLRVVMGHAFETVGLASVPTLNIRGRAEPVPDWKKLEPQCKRTVPVPEGSDNAGTGGEEETEDDEGEEDDAEILMAYENALPEEELREVTAMGEEKAKAFGELAAETYYDEINKIDKTDVAGILGPEYIEASAKAIGLAVVTPLICGPEFTSRIAEQWAASNVWTRQLMEEATIYERIAAIDAQAVALMTERDMLIATRTKKMELLQEEELRRQKLREAYGINQQIIAETDEIQSKIDKTRRDSRLSLSGHPRTPALSVMEELRQQRSKLAARGLPSLPSALQPTASARTAASKISDPESSESVPQPPQQERPRSQRGPPEPEAGEMEDSDCELLLSSQSDPQVAVSPGKAAASSIESGR